MNNFFEVDVGTDRMCEKSVQDFAVTVVHVTSLNKHIRVPGLHRQMGARLRLINRQRARWTHGITAMVAIGLASCGTEGPAQTALATGSAPPAVATAATRATPVIPGRRSRVFLFAALGPQCEPLAAPEIEITQPPAKGDVSLVPGQQTTIATSLTGACNGRPATGTGVYYTAREGTSGADQFTVTARSAGQSMARSFEVRIDN